MKEIAEVIVALCDLVEAEARNLRMSAVRKIMLFVVLFFVSLVGIVGFALIAWAFHEKILLLSDEITAAFFTGLLLLLAAGGGLWAAKKIVV